MSVVETDHLVVGATGLAFVDTLLDETDAHITVVDLHGAPGGHGNDAYPVVTLHQPSAGFGELMAPADRTDPQQREILTRLEQHAPGAVTNLTRLVEARTGAS